MESLPSTVSLDCHRRVPLRFQVEHELLLFAGANATAGSTATLQRRTGRAELMTTVREAPHPAVHAVLELDVEISWLLRQLTPSGGGGGGGGGSAKTALQMLQVAFSIDRSVPSCRTP